MSRELRQQERKSVIPPVQVMDMITEETVGQIGNLSVSGMMLIGPTVLNEGALYQLSFALPGDDYAVLEVGAECLWVSSTRTPGTCWAGLQFVDLSAMGREMLQAYLASH